MLWNGLCDKAILIDTCALIAISNPRDKYHTEASECLQQIAEVHYPIYITIPTIHETHRKILFDQGQAVGQQFLVSVFDGSLNIERTIAEDEEYAISLISKYTDQTLTLTDAVSMAVMVRLRIATVFSFDSHFLQVGFNRIPPFN